MAHQSVIVVDEFFDDPDRIRRIALDLDYYRKPGATYPGREAVAPCDWSDVRRKLRAYIDEAVDAACPKNPPFPQGKFRLALAEDEPTRVDRVHVDKQRWSAVVYLTLPENCCEGIALYRHRPTNSVFWDERWFLENYGSWYSLSDEEFRTRVLHYFKNPEHFQQIGLIPMAYNRVIFLMAQVLHGTGLAFGTSKENGRLSQHFEFYSAAT